MAGNVPPRIVEPIQTPQHYAPPNARELRMQAIYRLQVGLIGLCAMLLIVGLANIIMDRARLGDVREPVEQVVAVDTQAKKPASEPLADIGVVPAADPTPGSSPDAAQPSGAVPAP
ncbi:hypothetical protein [uncultured Novosphingobium sp.]|uniref:hypothetical protein n=1 Tax=uncultured Novosphingobium sp. TaxID=292277 RepID=UPI0025853DC8|nr:hypothetical protein [uncultured Novosphingobium sp.]